MPKFKFSSPNLTDHITHFIKQVATQSNYSITGLIDSASGEFTLAPCDRPLDANFEIRTHHNASLALRSQRNMPKSRSGKQFPIIYDAVSSVTSDEVYKEVMARYAPSGASVNSWKMFGIHYDAMHPGKLIISTLPYDLTSEAENGFLQGLIGTKFEWKFLMLQTAMMNAVHWIELDKLIEYDDATLQEKLNLYDREELIDFCRMLKSTQTIAKYSENPNYHLLMCLIESRIRFNESIRSLSESSGHVSHKQIKEVALFKPVTISHDCLESYREMEIFTKPVVTVDGQLYEYLEIKGWLDKNSDSPTSPLTNKALENKDTTLIPFKLLENILQRQKYEIFVEDLICPLTNRFMKEPVLASNGVLYEREAILKEFDKNPPSEKIKEIKSRKLIAMSWVNSRREELTKQNPHLLNPIRPPTEIATKSTHSAVLVSMEEKKLVNSVAEQEPKTSKQIYKILMDGVSFSILQLHDKTRLINAIMRERNDAGQRSVFSDLVSRQIHILVDMYDVYLENSKIFDYVKADADRFKKNIQQVRSQQLESIKDKLIEMSKIPFCTLQTEAEKIKYVYRLCTFDEARLDHLFTSQACIAVENLRALKEFLPVVFDRYNIAPYVIFSVTKNLEKHLEIYNNVDSQRHQREKEQKEQDNNEMQKPNDMSLQPRIKSASSGMYAPGVRIVQQPQPSAAPAARVDAAERSKPRAFQRT